MKDFKRLYNIAFSIAQSAHMNQQDKGRMPYLLHPIRVSQKCRTCESKIAALLHDVVEDSSIDLDYLRLKEIPERIVNAVDSLTRRKNESYKEYIVRISLDPIAIEVKIADLEDNMDISRLDRLTDEDITRLSKYHHFHNYLKEFGH